MRKKRINDDVNDELNEKYNSINQFDDQFDDQFGFQKQISFLDEQKKKKPKDREFYVKGADLIEEIRKYQKSKLEDAEKRGVPLEQGQGIISEQLGIMIIKIATRFSMHPRFYGYSYRDQMVADAVARMITNGVDKIDPDHPKCNPFAYLTQCAFNIFRQKIKNQKKYSQTKQRLREQVFTQFESDEGLMNTKDNQDEL